MVVNKFVMGLLVDLDHRCKRFLTMLESRPVHVDVAAFRHQMQQALQDLRQRIYDAQKSDALHHRELWTEALLDYQDLSRELALIEQFAIPVLLRYDERDHEFAKVVHLLVEQSGVPEELRPIVTVTSDQYYWVRPDYRVIGVPAGDIQGILGWPDFLHELGHILLVVWSNLIDGFTPIVKRYFKSRRYQLADIGASDQDSRLLYLAEMKWRDTWQVELAADLIATYLVGPSYVWQHMRLLVNHARDPYQPRPGEIADHPSDQCRFEAMLEMLKLVGASDQIAALEKRWDEILELSLADESPQGYDVYYPMELSQELARIIHRGCEQHGLVPFGRHAIAFTVVGIIHDAWQAFISAPDRHAAWEEDAIQRLGAALLENSVSLELHQ